MESKMKELFKKYREIIVYIIVGLMTTLVSFGVRFAIIYPGAALLSLDLNVTVDAKVAVLRTVAVSLGWAAGVIFAYFTNKHWVFQDKVKGKAETAKQFGKFVASRIGTYFVEWGISVLLPMLLLACGYKAFTFIINVDADMLSAVVSAVVVTVLNYIISKLLVFRKKKNSPES